MDTSSSPVDVLETVGPVYFRETPEKPIIYSRKGNFLSYGMKFYPWADQIELSEEQAALVALFK